MTSPSAANGQKHAKWTRVRWFTLILAGASLVVCAFSGQILVCNEDAEGHDHLLLLGGDKRFDVARDLFARSELRQVLLFRDADSNLVRFGILPPGHELARDELSDRGIPDEAISVIKRGSEASAMVSLREWMEQHEDTKIRVFTPRFNSRRTRYLLDRTLSDSQAARVRVVGLPDRRYDETNWWRSRTGFKAILSSSLDLVHTWCVGPTDPSIEERWDPIEYEQTLAATVRGSR